MSLLTHYFERIGYQGSATPDLTTLQALQALHPAAMAFENIDVLLNRGIDISLPAITHKLIKQQRGGYCFEHNGLFLQVLREIGFTAEPLMARAVWRQPSDMPLGPRTHMVLKVTLDDQLWLADVGFGGLVLSDPLRLTPDLEQEGRHETFRMLQHDHGHLLQVRLDDGWHGLYDIGSQPLEPIDIEVANWFTSAHPNSKFRHNLMCARVTRDTRYALLNNRLTVRAKDKEVVQQTLSRDELAKVLEEKFLLPVGDDWLAVLERVCVGGDL